VGQGSRDESHDNQDAQEQNVASSASQNFEGTESAMGEDTSGEGQEGGLKRFSANGRDRSDPQLMAKSLPIKKRNKSPFGGDRRRKHEHWQATIFYADGERFARVYLSKEKARRFADRERKSPVVKRTLVRRIK